jgi:RNase HII (EC 3.1.26.4)
MPDFTLELQLEGSVCGIDEAGRGPWAGPVVAAAVIFPDYTQVPQEIVSRLNDSKKLSAKQRDFIFAALTDLEQPSCYYGIGLATVQEIDQLNILQATLLAMQRAYQGLSHPINHALVDGISAPKLPCKIHCLPKGDGLSCSIAAASIIAKVTRDRLMHALAITYPHYGWDKNAGYGTKLHQAGLAQWGVTEHHRRSFAPIKALLQKAA